MIAGILGGSGYTGRELVRLLCRHPRVDSVRVYGRRSGEPLCNEIRELRGVFEEPVHPIDPERIIHETDLLFMALPHGVTMEYAPAFREKIPIIDLSGDYRLKTPDDYERWYRKPHRDGGALDRYVYGLPELNRDRIRGSRTIANPGCYPTAVLLALLPLVENRLVRSPVAVDAKSGHSGAGKKPSERLHAGNCAQNVQPYKVLNHQHVGEIEQVLGQCADRSFPVHFCPHLMPFDRGILCTVYAELLKDIENEELHRIVAGRYADHPFVRVFAGDDIPSLKLSIGTNFCDLHYTVDPRLGRVTVLSSIDNLLKGASGQAVQNMNLMLGFPEKEGLDA